MKLIKYFKKRGTQNVSAAQAKGYFNLLPSELLKVILNYLSRKEIANLSCTSITIHKMISNISTIIEIPFINSEKPALKIEGTYASLNPVLKKINIIDQRKIYAYNDEQEISDSIWADSKKALKPILLLGVVLILFGIIRAFLLDLGVRKRPNSDFDLAIFIFGMLSLTACGSTIYMCKNLPKILNSTTKDKLDLEIEETVTDYVKKQR